MLQYHDTVHSTPAGSTTKTTAVHDFSTSDGVWVVVVAVVPVSAVLLSQHIQIHTHIVINSSPCHWQQSTSIINSHQWNYCFVVKVSKRKSQYNTIGGRIDKSIIFAWQLLSSVIALNLELFSFVNREGNNFVAT